MSFDELACCRLCNDAVLAEAGGRWRVNGDPMEGALVTLAAKAGLDPESPPMNHDDYMAALDALKSKGIMGHWASPFLFTGGLSVQSLVAQFGGSISAEHGIGVDKRALLPSVKSPVEIGLMRQMKRTLDPLGIMNPGKLL